MNQNPVSGPYTPQQNSAQFSSGLMPQRPQMQWGQQSAAGVPQRYPMGPGGGMMHMYQGQPGQPQPGAHPSQVPQGAPQIYNRPMPPQGPPGAIMRPNQFPQPPMGMQPGYGSAPQPNRLIMHPSQGMPQPSNSTGPAMQNQFGQTSHATGNQPSQFPQHNFSTHNTSDAPPERGRGRGIPTSHLPIANVPGGLMSQTSAQAAQMGPPGPPQSHPQIPAHAGLAPISHGKIAKKKKRLSDKLLTDKIQEIVPESQAYMELLQFEKKIDETIQRKRLEVQEVLKKPQKLRKKLRIFISSSFFPADPDAENPDDRTPSWELRVEGRLLDDPSTGKVADPAKFRRKFSSFFKSLVIELDKNIYGPENYLVEWHRTTTTQETDGFQVKRPGEQNVVCKLHFMLDYQPSQFKLDARLARLLGIHTQTRTAIIMALWQYIRTHRLQDPHERDIVVCDKYLQQIFEVERLRFPDIPQAITGLLLPPEPIVVQHVVAVGPGEGQSDARRTSCYDIEVEVDDPLLGSVHQFMMNLQAQQEIAQLDSKIVETVDLINKSKTAKEFYSGFASDPQQFIDKWLASQCSDLKVVSDCEGNPEYDRRSSMFSSDDPTTREAVMRYFFNRIHQRRAELEQALTNGK